MISENFTDAEKLLIIINIIVIVLLGWVWHEWRMSAKEAEDWKGSYRRLLRRYYQPGVVRYFQQYEHTSRRAVYDSDASYDSDATTVSFHE